MMRALITVTMMLAAVLPARAGFEEFDHPTVDFDRQHTINGGSRPCANAPGPENFRGTNCYVLQRKVQATVKYVIHGIEEPMFWAVFSDPRLKPGFVYRHDILD